MWPEASKEQLTPAQLGVLKRAVRGKQVVDLGAGVWAPLSGLCASLGARLVTAVEMHNFEVDRSTLISRGVRLYRGEIQEFMRTLDGKSIDVALISWPWLSMSPSTVVRMLDRCRTVIYIGKNTDGVRCGGGGEPTHRAFWRELLRRPVVEHASARIQTAIVYGELTEHARPKDAWLDEELAALSSEALEYVERPTCCQDARGAGV